MTEKAIEKFIESMNRTSNYWTKDVQLVAQNGKIVLVKCEGFTWGSGTKEKQTVEKGQNEN